MNQRVLKELLRDYKDGEISEANVLKRLKTLPFESVEYAHIDHHRAHRHGFPEVIFGLGKSTEQIVGIAERIVNAGNSLLVTHASEKDYEGVLAVIPKVTYHKDARTISLRMGKKPRLPKRYICVVTAGTSDIPVAAEAAVTAEMMGNRVKTIYDVGVAGIHRVLHYTKILQDAGVIIVCAGMEGALASVVGGLSNKPVIAVPTSIGYGVSFEGVAALLGMLNSCSSGVTVVNIDNGFGAAYAASLIMKSRSGA